MPKFYATFGCGQPHAGRVIPINADDEFAARRYMRENYSNHYAMMYSEYEWLAVHEKFRAMGMEDCLCRR